MGVLLPNRLGVGSRRRAFLIELLEQRQLLAAVVFTVNPALSSLTLSGTIQTADGAVSLTPQAAGSLTTPYAGTIDADVEPGSIQFTNTSAIEAESNGIWEPGDAPGDYAAFAALASAPAPLVIRGLVAGESSGVLPISSGGDFSSTSQTLGITAGELDYIVQSSGLQSLVGLTNSNASTEISNYMVAKGIATLVLPIDVTYTTSVVSSDDTQLTLTGEIVATATAPVFGANIAGNVSASEPIPDVKVYIDMHNAGTFKSGDPYTTTDVSGNYNLPGLNPGTYVVRQVLPPGFKQTSPSNNYGINVMLTANQTVTTANFTDAALPGTISGTIHAPALLPNVTVYLDTNNNGTLDKGEPKAVTNAAGSYIFVGVNPGAYIIRQITPKGYKQITPTDGHGFHATLVAGRPVINADFNDAQIGVTTGSISGTVFSDNNGNGLIDSGEIGLSGWTIYLDLNDSYTLLPGDPVALTGTNGDFAFSNLLPGKYIIRTVQQPAWIQTFPENNLGQSITLAAGRSITGVLFGEISDG